MIKVNNYYFLVIVGYEYKGNDRYLYISLKEAEYMRNEKNNTIMLIKKNKRVIVYFAISIIILTSVLILGYDIGLIKALGIGICGYLLAFVIASTSLRNILLYVKYRCFGNDKLSIEIDEICNEIYHRSSDRNNRININIRNEGKDEVLFLAKDTISVAKGVVKLPIECIKALIARFRRN